MKKIFFSMLMLFSLMASSAKAYDVEIDETDPEDLAYLTNYGLSHFFSGSPVGRTMSYTRTFYNNTPSTICLPFSIDLTKTSISGELYEFKSVEKVGELGFGGYYVATMVKAGETANQENTTLEANKPYMYVLRIEGGSRDVTFTGTIASAPTAGTTTPEGSYWKFKGTYETIEWTSAPWGVYGFAAETENGVEAGEFIKAGAYTRVRPMRCYLKYTGDDSTWPLVRSEAPAAEETLPETIKVRFVDANGDVTAIGSLSTKTGEVTFDKDVWYSLEGKRFDSKPSQKGVYVNNGKKVVVK